MIDWGALALLLSGMTGFVAEPSAHEPIQFSQIIVREQIIVRMPVRRGEPAPAPHALHWEEKGDQRCIPAKNIAGASLMGQESVDLLLRDRSRIRARLERRCPALDYYQGFYISPGSDGMICADRDVIRSRMGGQCEIEEFKKLRVKKGR